MVYHIDNALFWYDSKQETRQAQPDLSKLAEPKSVTFIPSKLEDKPMLLQKDPGYMASLMALPTIDMERLYHGNWKIIAERGNIFDQSCWNFVNTSPEDQRIIVR